MYDLTVSIHKGTCASANLNHNMRTIAVPHCDKSRTVLNEIFCDLSAEEAYRILFDDALRKYNKGKKPSRQIKNYYKHIYDLYENGEKRLGEARASGASWKEQAKIRSSYQKPFNELIITVGNRDAYNGIFRTGAEKEDICLSILREYMAGFQKRNPHLYVFNAHLHRDETNGVNHIHLDYIPWSDINGRGLPVRLSENGAFMQQGLTSGHKGDIGSIAFQNKEREVIAEISKKYMVNIVDGKHSHRHLSKEEYILEQEKEKVKTASESVNKSAEKVISYQNEFADYVRKSGNGTAFAELIKLKESKKQYDKQMYLQKRQIAEYWTDFKTYTSTYFSAYRESKQLLYNELQQAREQNQYNKNKVADLLFSIANNNDLLIIKFIKLLAALFLFAHSATLDNEVERLEQINQEIKQQAKSIMAQSQSVSAELRKKNIETATQKLTEFEISVTNSLNIITENNKIAEKNNTER